MASQWTTGAATGSPSSDQQLSTDDKFVVLLLYGKNSFGDKIYSFVKINLANFPKLRAAIQAGKGFTPSDFGEVIAAGKGEPTPQVRAEVAAMYPVMDGGKPAAPAAPPAEKKAWDEY